MSQPKPIKENYKITKETKKDLKSTIKPLMEYAVKGNKRFVEETPKTNWESLSSKDVLVLILMMLSYGLKTNQKLFESYIKKENTKSSTSFFKFMHDCNGLRIKDSMKTDDFTSIFNSLFVETDPEKTQETFKNLKRRVTKIKEKDFSKEEIAEIDSLMESLIEGREI